MTGTRASARIRARNAAPLTPAGSARSRSPLAQASTAPAPSAAAAFSPSGPTWLDSTTTGTGVLLMISSTAIRPSMPGSSRSMVTRSGRCAGSVASASSAVEQTPITVMSWSYSSARRSPAA